MIRASISLIASIFIEVQVYLLSSGNSGLCFNNGCEIVDQFTSISPVYFNIAGVVYFQLLFWLFILGRKGTEYWHNLARLLLLAGLAAEAVLVFFQYRIVSVFCSYCLVVFGVVVLLNFCCGLRQLLRGLVLFCAVIIPCLGLQFGVSSAYKNISLDAGSLGIFRGKNEAAELYLFFSSSCTHCEKIIELITSRSTCSVHFNPVEKLPSEQVPFIEKYDRYDHQINLMFLRSLSVSEVPVLLIVNGEGKRIVQGEKMIRDYFEATCYENDKDLSKDLQNIGSRKNNYFLKLQTLKEETCAVGEECESQTTKEESTK